MKIQTSSEHWSAATPYLWQFLEVGNEGGQQLSLTAISDSPEEVGRYIEIKITEGKEWLLVSLCSPEWNFADGERVKIVSLFPRSEPEEVWAQGSGGLLWFSFPISAAPVFLYLIAASDQMLLSFPDHGFLEWRVGMLFSEPSARAMIHRLIDCPELMQGAYIHQEGAC